MSDSVSCTAVRQSHGTMVGENTMSMYGTRRMGSAVATAGAMAARCGGWAMAAYHVYSPGLERPIMPTLPLLPGSPAAHSTASYPSCSCSVHVQHAVRAPRPRTSCFT